MNVPELHRRAVEGFGDRVRAVRDDQWESSTPCTDWDVCTLVNHIVAENLWTPPLMEGRTVEEVGDHFDGDVLGTDPKGAWEDASKSAVAAVSEEGAMERTVHLSFGDFPGSEYALQLLADHVIHGWDLARGTGGDDKLDPELVDACIEWFKSVEDAYRAADAIGARPDIPADADPQTTLLAMFGRDARWEAR